MTGFKERMVDCDRCQSGIEETAEHSFFDSFQDNVGEETDRFMSDDDAKVCHNKSLMLSGTKQMVCLMLHTVDRPFLRYSEKYSRKRESKY